jgi:hypothetical protein
VNRETSSTLPRRRFCSTHTVAGPADVKDLDAAEDARAGVEGAAVAESSVAVMGDSDISGEGLAALTAVGEESGSGASVENSCAVWGGSLRLLWQLLKRTLLLLWSRGMGRS